MEGLEFKSKCLIDLNMAETFRELPKAFHTLLFDELYGDFVRNISEFSEILSEPQLQALANALSLEIYLPEDMIIEEGRIGTKLFIMKKGKAELFASRSKMVFAAVHEGVLFGDLSFFLAGTKQLVSVRASGSCQVLCIHHREWMQLWSETTRLEIERKIVPIMKSKYRSMSRSFLNIFKNFELARSGPTDRSSGSKQVSKWDMAAETIAEETEDDDADRHMMGSSNPKTRAFGLGQDSSQTDSPQTTPPSLTAKGSRRKLSAHLGLSRRALKPQLSSILQPSAAVNIEEEWKRHERNLQELTSIDRLPELSPRTVNEGHSYAKHLETLRARSKRRKHQSVFQSEDDLDELENPYEIWVEPPLPPSFCMENSSFRRVWNAIMLVICWYYILVVPFRISFDFEFLTTDDNSHEIAGWFILEYILDILCVIDFFLQKDFFTYIYKGEIVTDKKAIRNHYWKEGSYISDLLCITPFEVLAPLYSTVLRQRGVVWDVTWYRISVFRMNKMVRINHLHELSERVQRSLVYDWRLTWITPSAVYFTRFAFDFALGAHWVACFFYSFSYNMFIEDGRASWLTTPGMLTYAGCTGIASIGDVPVTRKFARTFYFSIGATTTVSYGDIAPQNAIETALGTLVIVVSIVLFGMLSGGFFHLFEMELGQRADYEERVARVANYMTFHRFHTRIWEQMQVYFAVHWQESKGMDEDELLRGLTTSVKQDIVLWVKREFVVQMKLFATCEEAFVRAVVTAFLQELYVRHDVIIAEGDTGRSLYVIENGSVLVRIAKKQRTPIAKSLRNVAAAALESSSEGSRSDTIELVKGRFDFFGEKSLILDVPRSATCIALSACSMLILTVEKYREILDDFPDYRERNMRDWIFANTAPDDPLQNPRP